MAVKTKKNRQGRPPLSYFISVKIGKMKFGNYNVASSDPESVKSLVITKLSDGDFTKSNNDRNENSKIIKNDRIITPKNLDNLSEGALFSQAVITMTMANNLQLEKKLINYIKKNLERSNPVNEVSFRYGYVSTQPGQGLLKSFTYYGTIVNMALSSDFYTLSLTLAWTNKTTGKYSQWKKKTKTEIKKIYKKKRDKKTGKLVYKNKKIRISDIVKTIAKNQKWKIGTITQTKKIRITSVHAPDSTKTPVEYINSIKGKAVAVKGGGKYKSRFVFNRSGDVVYEFVPQTFKGEAGYRAKRDFNFYMNLLPNGVVLNFKPVLVDGVAVAGLYNTANLSKKDKKKKNKEFKNIFGVITNKEVTKVKYTVANSKKNAKGLLGADDKVVAASASAAKINATMDDIPNYAEAIIKNDFGKYAYSTAMNASATMEILGDPQLQCGDLINVIPMYPCSDAKTGAIMHPSGGTYRIISLQDSVGDQFITSMELVKETNTKKLKKVTVSKSKNKKKKKSKTNTTYKVGEVVKFEGGKYYTQANKSAKGKDATQGPAKILKISNNLLNTKGAHPYKLKHTTDESNVAGWVDVGSFVKEEKKD